MSYLYCVFLFLFFFFFFFQAEDGIRDYKVTGVQTCALPITLKVLPTREPHEAVRVERIGGSGDAFMMEGESLLSPDRGNFCVELSGALPASKLLRAVPAPIQATGRHGRVEFERQPRHRDGDLPSNEMEGLLEPSLPDVAPRTDDVRDYLEANHWLRRRLDRRSRRTDRKSVV